LLLLGLFIWIVVPGSWIGRVRFAGFHLACTLFEFVVCFCWYPLVRWEICLWFAWLLVGYLAPSCTRVSFLSITNYSSASTSITWSASNTNSHTSSFSCAPSGEDYSSEKSNKPSLRKDSSPLVESILI
jgi:hypothetical protein